MDFLVDALLPRRCLNCKSLVTRRTIFCCECQKQIKAAPKASTPHSIQGLFIYGAILRRLILQAKFNPDESTGKSLAFYLGDYVATHRENIDLFKLKYDAITYVPTHWRRRLTRGFELPGLLARTLACSLNSPFQHYLLCARYDPPLSNSRSANQRRVQVQGRYAARAPQGTPLNILLVDDIVTTGATISAAAKELERLGHNVKCFAFAQTIIA